MNGLNDMIIKWGIVGLGNMANAFAKAISETTNSKLICVASKSKPKLELFAKNFDIATSNRFSNYSELIRSKEIDAVYISTLNNTHVELLLECVKNDKKILCEKPIAVNLDQANLAYNALEQKKDSFYEAIAYRSHPQTINLFQTIARDEIGDIKKIVSTFGFKIKRIKKDSRLFSKKFGGGTILDIGCYPVSFFNLFKKENENIKLLKSNGTFAITGVEDDTEAEFLIGKNIVANCKISFKTNLKNSCTIYGTKGTINIPSPWLPPVKSYIEVFNDNFYYKSFTTSKKSVYAMQVENISNLFIKKQKKKIYQVNIDESVEIADILDKWRLSLV
jgi:predicted dehydrogenase